MPGVALGPMTATAAIPEAISSIFLVLRLRVCAHCEIADAAIVVAALLSVTPMHARRGPVAEAHHGNVPRCSQREEGRTETNPEAA